MAQETQQTSTQFDVGAIVENGRTWFRTRLPSFLIVLGLLILWWIYSNFINTIGNIYFPSMTYVVQQTLNYQDIVLAGMKTTLTEIIAGYILAVIIGVVVGVIFAESFVLRQMALPELVFAYSLPHAIVAPVFILWFGSGLFGIALFVAWFGFFSVLVNTITGFNSVEEEFHQLGDVVGATEWQMIRKIKFWAALPHITSGAKIALQQSIVGAIIAEFIATGSGLGYIVISANKLNREGLLFGVLIVIMVFAILLYKLVTKIIEAVTPPSV